MSELPSGWIMRRLADVAEVRLGRQRSPARAEGPNMRPYMRAANVSWAGLNIADVKEMDFTSEEFEVFGLRNGDVLVGEASGSRLEVGKSAIWRDEVPGACFQNTLIRVRCGPELLPEYLQKHLLHDARSGALAQIAKGIGIHHLGAQGLANWRIAVPPLEQQKRIADKLDALLARVDACRAGLEATPTHVARVKRSVYAAATTGALTSEWRAERGRTTDDWSESALGDCIDGIEAGLNVQCDERPPEGSERGLVKISAVTWGRYDESQSKTLRDAQNASERARIAVGDFLISRANTLELVGACVIVDLVTRNLFLSDKVLRLGMPSELKPWMLIALRSPEGRRQIESLASGNQLSMRNLSQANLRAVRIPLPPPDEREEIVRRCNELLSRADSLASLAAKALAKVNGVAPSLLAKAFRGDLVPQDPTDEPADALLALLRAAAPEPNPTVKPTRSRKATTASTRR